MSPCYLQQHQQKHQKKPMQHLNKNPNSILRRADCFVETPEKPGTPAFGKGAGRRNKEPRVLHRPPHIFAIAREEERKEDERKRNEERDEEEEIPNGFFKCKSEAIEVFARCVRKKLHLSFYKLGFKIQRHFVFVALFSFIILAVFIWVPLKRHGIIIETDIENMWVASTGRLKEELTYSEKVTGRKGFQGEKEFGAEVLMQTAKDDNYSMLTAEALYEHLELVKKVKDIKSKTFGQEWTLRHICDRYRPPDFGVAHDWNKAINNMVPCLVMTPLDCFWEGAIIASYGTHYTERLHEKLGNLTEGYMYHNPQELVNYLKEGKSQSDKIMYKQVKRFVDKVGIGAGYMDRPCFSTGKCPSFKNVTNDIPGQFKNGCYGVAKDYMYWPKDLVISKTYINITGYVSAKALQTVFKILSPKDFHLDIEMSRKFATRDFGVKEATQVINDWKEAFTDMVNKENRKGIWKANVLAFSTTSFKEKVKDFSTTLQQDSTYVGLILLTVYSIFTLKRWSSSIYSYGAIGLFGVVCSVMSVLAGLCLASLSNMNLNTISVQVLPFLALGLGLDNIYLMARTYVFVCDQREFKCKEIIGMCLGEVGLDITLSSFANAIAFLLASLIPLGAVQTFARQAAIIYVVNWFAVIFAYSSILSMDILRQRRGHMDLLFCFKECADEEEEDENETHHISPEQIQSNLSMSFPGATPDLPPINAQGNLTISATGPPPPQTYSQWREGFEQRRFNRNLIRGAHEQRNPHRSFNVDQADIQNEKKKKKKLKKPLKETSCKNSLFKLSLTYFAQHHYGAWLVNTSVKATTLVLFVAMLILALVGSLHVTKGLDLTDMVPKDTTEYKYFAERQKYFSYYKIYIVVANQTDGTRFDYAKNQKLLYEFHDKLYKIDKMVKSPNQFWLPVFRDWLKEWHQELLVLWSNKIMNKECAPKCPGVRMEVQRILQLLQTSLPFVPPPNQMDCLIPAHYRDKDNMRRILNRLLVNDQGIINPDLFYLALSLWHTEDSLGLWESQVEILPRPPLTDFNNDCHFFPQALKTRPDYTTISFQVHNLRTNDDYVKLIKDVRAICDEFKDRGLRAFPAGIPFTYWEQFVFLDNHLIMSMSIVLTSIFLVSLVCSMNLTAALFVVGFLSVMLFEAFGFIGLYGIKLSAISIIPMMMTVGTGTQFIVHTVMAFVNTQGNRNRRMRGALEIMFSSVFDCCISSIIMISCLSSSQYDFIVKYFFHLMLWIVCVAMVNTLLILPVMLSLFGPCLEKINGRNAITPVQCPTYFVQFPRKKTEWSLPPVDLSDLSAVPEESSCLNSERGNSPTFKSNSSFGGCASKNSMKNSTITLEDFDDGDDQDTNNYVETEFNERPPTPRAWLHNPSACSMQSNHNKRNRINYRDLPARRPSLNNNSRQKDRNNIINGGGGSSKRFMASTQAPPPYEAEERAETSSGSTDRSSYWTSGHGQPRQTASAHGMHMGRPSFVQVENNNRVTTKIKTTLMMEVEYSHPNATSRY